MAKRKSGIPGLSFSWRKALGVTKAKRKIARYTGIPTTKSGRRAKVGRMLTSGCLLPCVAALLVILLFVSIL